MSSSLKQCMSFMLLSIISSRLKQSMLSSYVLDRPEWAVELKHGVIKMTVLNHPEWVMMSSSACSG